jgi:predicted dehydrogenase
MTEQVGVAILGCGYWGINYVRVFNELPESRVLAVCDQRADRLREVERQFPGVQLTTEVEDVLALDGVDVAIVCTPATTHYNVTRRCFEADKHVLVEKPITTTVADAEELTALAEARGLILMVGHTFLYNPGVLKIKDYIKQGDMGRLYYLYARRTNLGPIRQDVNALWDLAPHDVAIFNYLLESTPEWVSAVGAKVLRNCREDVGFISLGYPSGIVGHIHVSWADAYKVREVVVVGSDKRIVFNDFNVMERVRVFQKGVTLVEPEASSYGEHFLMRDGDIISPRIEISEPLKNQCNHFLKCVTQKQRPLSGGSEGQEVVRVMEAIDRSIACNGAPIALKAVGEPVGQETIDDSVERKGAPVKVV